MIRTLDFLTMGAALMVALFTVWTMLHWPLGRDPRPMAPVLALSIAFILLKMHPAFGWEDAYDQLRNFAWRGWFLGVFANFIIFVYLQGRPRDSCGLGGACAATRGRR